MKEVRPGWTPRPVDGAFFGPLPRDGAVMKHGDPSRPGYRLLHPGHPKSIYERELVARHGLPVLSHEAATSLLQAVLTREGVPHADEAYVQGGYEKGSAATGWDHELSPPIPFMAVGEGTPDALTVVHEAAHMVINQGRSAPSWEFAHRPEWEAKFLEMLAFWEPDAARKMGRVAKHLPGLHDQKTHGHRSVGFIAQRIARVLGGGSEGFTMHPRTGHLESSGYVVAKPGSRIFDSARFRDNPDVSIDEVTDWLVEIQANFTTDDRVRAGLWRDVDPAIARDEFVFDHSVLLPNTNASLRRVKRLGRRWNQQYAFHLDTKTPIPTGGTGR